MGVRAATTEDLINIPANARLHGKEIGVKKVLYNFNNNFFTKINLVFNDQFLRFILDQFTLSGIKTNSLFVE